MKRKEQNREENNKDLERMKADTRESDSNWDTRAHPKKCCKHDL